MTLPLTDHAKKVVFDRVAHRYTIDGRPLSSVTRILREQGMSPFGTGEPSVVTTKMQIGTWLHNMLCLHFLDRLNENSISPAMLEVLEAVKGWVKEQSLIPLAVEVPLAHSLYWYAGTPDLVAMKDDKVVVIDWKWGVPKPMDILQLGGYVELACNCYQFNQKQMVAAPVYLKDLLVGRNVRKIHGVDLHNAVGTFLAANACHRWRIANGMLPVEGPAEEEDQFE